MDNNKHINSCEHFTYITNLLKLNIDEYNSNERFDLTLFLLHNSIILDKAKHCNSTIEASRELFV